MDHVYDSLRRWYDIWEELIEYEIEKGADVNGAYIQRLKRELGAIDKAMDILVKEV